MIRYRPFISSQGWPTILTADRYAHYRHPHHRGPSQVIQPFRAPLLVKPHPDRSPPRALVLLEFTAAVFDAEKIYRRRGRRVFETAVLEVQPL
jgi:hypothetical protein